MQNFKDTRSSVAEKWELATVSGRLFTTHQTVHLLREVKFYMKFMPQ